MRLHAAPCMACARVRASLARLLLVRTVSVPCHPGLRLTEEEIEKRVAAERIKLKEAAANEDVTAGAGK